MATIRTALVIDLEGNVVGEVRKVNEALDVSGTQAEKTGGRFKSFFDRSVKGFQKVRETVFSLSGALAGIGIGAVVTRSLNEADKIQKLAIKLGDSAERISAMRHVAAGAGIDFDQMMTSWQRMGRRISEVATSDTGPAAEALERLKLSADSLASLPPTDQFLAIADAMTGIANAGERMDIAQAIFDSEGVANVQAMQKGAQGIVSAMEEARQLGFVLTQQQVDQAAQANDAITRVTNALSGAVQRIATEFAPHIERLANALTSEEGLGAIRSFASGLGWLLTNLESIAKVVALVVSASYLPALIGLLMTPLGPVIPAVTGLAAAFIMFRDEISSAPAGGQELRDRHRPVQDLDRRHGECRHDLLRDLGNAISERIAVWASSRPRCRKPPRRSWGTWPTWSPGSRQNWWTGSRASSTRSVMPSTTSPDSSRTCGTRSAATPTCLTWSTAFATSSRAFPTSWSIRPRRRRRPWPDSSRTSAARWAAPSAEFWTAPRPSRTA
ncbi:MAG: hypothetical protein M5U09_18970 [Gammaproteobacteria bacterium]|nr:hypothetical protein [Gammaproteobacteria bacterium]